MTKQKANLRALECEHQPRIFTAAGEARRVRHAINALPPNLLFAIWSAIEGVSPHGLTARDHIEHLIMHP